MAELELTEEEEDAGSFLNWDDAALGKMVKKKAIEMEDYYGDNVSRREAAVVTLVSEVSERDTNMAIMEVDGVIADGEDLGTWRITFEKIDPDVPGEAFGGPQDNPDGDEGGGTLV